MNTIEIKIADYTFTFMTDADKLKNWVLNLSAGARLYRRALTEVGQFLENVGCDITGEKCIGVANLFEKAEKISPDTDDVFDVITFDNGQLWCERKVNALKQAVDIVEGAEEFASAICDREAAIALHEIKENISMEMLTMQQNVESIQILNG